jgi:peptide/nickel transport system substrate-binding protein
MNGSTVRAPTEILTTAGATCASIGASARSGAVFNAAGSAANAVEAQHPSTHATKAGRNRFIVGRAFYAEPRRCAMHRFCAAALRCNLVAPRVAGTLCIQGLWHAHCSVAGAGLDFFLTPRGGFVRFNLRSLLITAALAIAGAAAHAESVLRIGMTAADIPATTSQPDSGFEGNRFIGLTLFDALTMWDLSSADKPSVIIPGLATEWKVDDQDKTKWTFKLRKGVKFHDGSDFNADAAIFNFEKVLDKSKPHYDPRLVAQTLPRMPTLKGARKIDDYTLEIETSEPDAFLPINLANLFFGSPSAWAKSKSWTEFAKAPVGTGPWKFVRLVPRERLELVKNTAYWNPQRVPKTDRLVLIPMPEGNTRVAALLSGQVDWIEAPPADTIAQLRVKGFQITNNPYPHTWPWQLNVLPGTPLADKRVRQALQLAVDREGLRRLLGFNAVAAKGVVFADHPWFGKPAFDIKYDPEKAKKLLAEAGYGPGKPLKLKVQISASGSGQMQPLAMNEFIQQQLKEVGVDVDFDVIVWETLFNNWRLGAKDPAARGANAINVSFAWQDPFFGFARFYDSRMVAPRSVNWGYIQDPELDKLVAATRGAFDTKARDAALAKLHEKVVDDSYFLFWVHDTGPRALSPKLKGYVQAKNWFQDLSPVRVE